MSHKVALVKKYNMKVGLLTEESNHSLFWRNSYGTFYKIKQINQSTTTQFKGKDIESWLLENISPSGMDIAKKYVCQTDSLRTV